jgi:hypothetical protein
MGWHPAARAHRSPDQPLLSIKQRANQEISVSGPSRLFDSSFAQAKRKLI